MAAAALVAIAGCVIANRDVRAETTVQIGAAKRTATVSVYIGKSEDVRTDTSFVDITVGDPDVARLSAAYGAAFAADRADELAERITHAMTSRYGETRVGARA